MSLRAEIRAAIDEVTPPAPALTDKIATYVDARDKHRIVVLRRRIRWARPLRGTLAAVAALLVIAFMAGLVVGGRLWRQADTSNAHPINQAELKQLEARPLNLPLLMASDPCPADGPMDSRGRYGQGPIYLLGGTATADSWGAYWNVEVYVDPGISGPVLVRGRDLKTGLPVLFDQPILFGAKTPGATAHGPIYDSAQPSLHTELVIDPTAWKGWEAATGGEHYFSVVTAFKNGHSGCIGWQVDGRGFGQNWVGASFAN